MNATRFRFDTSKKAITRKTKNIKIAKISQTHFAHELLNVEKAHKAKTIHTASMIS